jgi:hypothetical protein
MSNGLRVNRREAALFLKLQGWAAAVLALPLFVNASIIWSAPHQPDALHTHLLDLRGGRRAYLTDSQDQIALIARYALVIGLAIILVLTFAYWWFDRREKQEAQKQLLIDEFGPKDSN